MSTGPRHPQTEEFVEAAGSLWRLVLCPTIWALHFAASYAATALFCGRLAEAGDGVLPLRGGVVVATAVALALILWLGWQAWRQWNIAGHKARTTAESGNETRHRFMGRAGFLLAIISFVGVVYVTLPVLLIGTCR